MFDSLGRLIQRGRRDLSIWPRKLCGESSGRIDVVGCAILLCKQEHDWIGGDWRAEGTCPSLYGGVCSHVCGLDEELSMERYDGLPL